jgi:glycosyltransferase involved in cell wall biosynthesis
VTPVVTVVTPVYNGAAHLEPTLRSVREQTLGDVLHVVVDDGSTDATPEIVASAAAADPRLRVVRQANQGLSTARNNGLAHVPPGSEFVMFLDDDDVLRPAALEQLTGALRADPACVAAHGAVAAIDGAGRPVPLVRGEAATRRRVVRPERVWTSRRDVRELASWEPSDFAALAYVLFVYTVGQVLIRPAPLAAVGAFDPRLRVAQDYDLWLRLATLGPLRSVSDVVLDYRQGEVSLSADQTTTRREDLHARFKAITDRRAPAATRRAARDNHRHHEWHRAADRLDYARVALRDRDLGLTGREAVRSARSAVEAILAVPPWTWPYDRRVRTYRRRWEVG